jgi:alginate O-acetyltransferase complex protein AlgI
LYRALLGLTVPTLRGARRGIVVQFCTLEFLAFFAAVLAVYWALPSPKARVRLLLVSSFFFYARWNKWLALLIGVSTALDYLLALGMDRPGASPRLRKVYLGTSLAANLGLLCYFKYANFFLGSFLTAFGLSHDPAHPLLKVILPVGISFYTFEAINYTVDVFRRKVPAERSLPDFMLFITFFPHLVAGPIVRARDFLPQIKRPKRWSWQRLHLGARCFLMGFVKKVIADRMADFSDPVFAGPQGFRTEAVWLGVLAYAVQIYCDFSGYTDMAIGCAHCFGYKLAQNFNLPYVASNVSEFWHRWHISLSSWLRDYLFIPLGGSRDGERRTARNLMVTMTLGGLWHGAAWNFVAWGVLHGLYLVVHRGFRAFCKPRPRLDAALQSPPGTVLRVGLTLTCVCVGWVFFRSPSFTTAARVLRGLVAGGGLAHLPRPVFGLWLMLAVVVAAHLAAPLVGRRRQLRLPPPVLGFGYAVALTLALLLMPSAAKQFIYFQF